MPDGEQYRSRVSERVLKSALWLMSGRLFRLAFGVVVYALVARYLQPADFGVLMSALATMSILEIAGRMGLNQPVLRDMVRDPDSASDLLGTVILVRMTTALFGFLLATSFGWMLSYRYESAAWVFPIVALTLFPSIIADALTLWFQSRTSARPPVVVDAVSVMVANLSRIGLLAARASLGVFAALPCLIATLRAVGLLAIARRKGMYINFRLRNNGGLSILKENWPLAFSQLAGILYLKVDQLMLVGMSSAFDAGVYGAALRISEAWYFIPAALCISLKPTLTKLRDKNPLRYRKILQETYSAVTLISVGAAVVTTLFATFAVETLFGQAYLAAAPVLTIHIWAGVFVFWRRVQSEWLINERHLKFGMSCALIGASSNIVLNLLLIPRYGAMGAAIATLIASFLTVVPANVAFPPARTALALQLRSLVLTGLMDRTKRWMRRTVPTHSTMA